MKWVGVFVVAGVALCIWGTVLVHQKAKRVKLGEEEIWIMWDFKENEISHACWNLYGEFMEVDFYTDWAEKTDPLGAVRDYFIKTNRGELFDRCFRKSEITKNVFRVNNEGIWDNPYSIMHGEMVELLGTSMIWIVDVTDACQQMYEKRFKCAWGASKDGYYENGASFLCKVGQSILESQITMEEIARCILLDMEKPRFDWQFAAQLTGDAKTQCETAASLFRASEPARYASYKQFLAYWTSQKLPMEEFTKCFVKMVSKVGVSALTLCESCGDTVKKCLPLSVGDTKKMRACLAFSPNFPREPCTSLPSLDSV